MYISKKCERSSTLEIQNKIISKFNKQGVKKRDSYISTGCYYLKDSSILQNYPKEYFMIENLLRKYVAVIIYMPIPIKDTLLI